MREEKEREKKERLERERREREEKERRNAHVAEVTSMELPLDWENLFLSDERTQGVHADSIPDGLIRSLATLGRVDIIDDFANHILHIKGEPGSGVQRTMS